jgi:sporulation protein YlmC with PRC-barrel domain
MRKFSILLSLLVLAAIVLAACGGEERTTSIPTDHVLPITAEVTGTSVSGAVTEVPMEGTGTPGTPEVPVTGELNSARLSEELDFTVWNKDGEQIGEVDDMVLDLENVQVAYVLVNTSGFGDLGDRKILVPVSSLQLQTGTGDTTSGQQNAFILQTDQDTFNNAPDFDPSTLPPMGQSATDWETSISDYWQKGGSGGIGNTSNTPSASGTTAVDTTATAGTGTGLATATTGTATGGGTGLGTATAETGTGAGTTALQGVALASDVLGSTVTIGAQGQGNGPGNGTGTGLATATAGSGTEVGLGTATAETGTGSASTGSATATASTGTGTDVATATTGTGTGTGNMVATIEDMILDTATGDILYVVLNTNSGTDQLIPVPLSMFQWDGSAQVFALNADATMLQNAPSFAADQFPDTTTSGWNNEFDSFWQNNEPGGTGTGGQATPTP